MRNQYFNKTLNKGCKKVREERNLTYPRIPKNVTLPSPRLEPQGSLFVRLPTEGVEALR